jgi:hypothetical protein
MITETKYKILNNPHENELLEITDNSEFADIRVECDGDCVIIRKDSIIEIIEIFSEIAERWNWNVTKNLDYLEGSKK